MKCTMSTCITSSDRILKYTLYSSSVLNIGPNDQCLMVQPIDSFSITDLLSIERKTLNIQLACTQGSEHPCYGKTETKLVIKNHGCWFYAISCDAFNGNMIVTLPKTNNVFLTCNEAAPTCYNSFSVLTRPFVVHTSNLASSFWNKVSWIIGNQIRCIGSDPFVQLMIKTKL